MSAFVAEGVGFDRVFAVRIAQCTMYAADLIDERNGEDFACDGGDEDNSSVCLLSKIILLASKVLSKEQLLHGKPRCGIVLKALSAFIESVR